MSCSAKGKKLLREWQSRLGLQEWRIKLLDNCDPDDMELPDCAGCTDWSESIKTARIEIMNPLYYGDRIVPFDYEKTLVHELLHLKTCLLTDVEDPLTERVGHMLIDDLARIMVALKREATD